jgi:putative ABC transport system permease protein
MFETFKLAFKELVANKGRTVLTALGIAIGVMAITLIISSGDIAKQYISNYLTKSIGKTNTLVALPFSQTRADAAKMTYSDNVYIDKARDIFPIVDVSSIYTKSYPIKNFLAETIQQQIRGVDMNYQLVSANKNILNLDGRYFSANEYDTGASVIVISKQFSRDVLGKSTSLNELVEIKSQKFQVIGEYEGQDSLTGDSKEVLIPLPTLWKLSQNSESEINQVIFTVQDESQAEYVSANLGNQINDYRAKTFTGDKARALTFRTSKAAVESISGVLTGFQLFLSLVAVIALVVGGIGVLNVMLMAVSQRIKEIGIRKAFGAKNSDILLLFLSESVALTSLSGLFGALLAQYLVFVGVRAANYFLPDLGLIATYSWSSLYIAFVLSAILGVLFGVYPAYKAGKMSVVDALRYE